MRLSKNKERTKIIADKLENLSSNERSCFVQNAILYYMQNKDIIDSLQCIVSETIKNTIDETIVKAIKETTEKAIKNCLDKYELENKTNLNAGQKLTDTMTEQSSQILKQPTISKNVNTDKISKLTGKFSM